MYFAAKTPPRFATLALATGLPVLSMNIFLPSLPGMAADLQTDYRLISLSISGFLATTAVLQLVIGPLSDRYGRRPVMIACIAIFVIASLGCFLATNVWAFLACRVVQGAVIAGSTLARAAVVDTRSAREAASLIGYIGMAMAIAPMIGPLVGGLIDEFYDWRATFLALSALGAAAFVLCWVDLGETNLSPSSTLTSQAKAYPELFRSRRFRGYAMCMAFSQGGFYSFLAGAPLAAQALFDLTPSELGVCMGSTAAGFLCGSFLSGRFAPRFALSTMMIAGRIVACAGLVAGLALLAAGATHVAVFFGAAVAFGVGNGVTMPSSNAGAMSVRPRLTGAASGLSGALAIGGGSLMMTLVGAAISEANAPFAVLGAMLLCAALGLAAALDVRRLERIENAGLPTGRKPV